LDKTLVQIREAAQGHTRRIRESLRKDQVTQAILAAEDPDAAYRAEATSPILEKAQAITAEATCPPKGPRSPELRKLAERNPRMEEGYAVAGVGPHDHVWVANGCRCHQTCMVCDWVREVPAPGHTL
jgi:hypothetical protein